MLSQVITLLVIALISGIVGWYLGLTSQRRVADRGIGRPRDGNGRGIADRGDSMALAPESTSIVEREGTQDQQCQVDDLIAANSHYVDLIATELESAYSSLKEVFNVLNDLRGFRFKIMESVILTHSHLDRILRIAAPVEESIDLLKDLNRSLGRIENRSVNVRTIAAEVNLLAANAGLEVSRAGEAGRGFSMVADCMRKLSDKSADAITDVFELVAQTRTDLGRIIQALESNGEYTRGADEVLIASNELESELTRIDQISEHSLSSLDRTTRSIHGLEYKVHALADSLANGLAGIFDQAGLEKPETEREAPVSGSRS